MPKRNSEMCPPFSHEFDFLLYNFVQNGEFEGLNLGSKSSTSKKVVENDFVQYREPFALWKVWCTRLEMLSKHQQIKHDKKLEQSFFQERCRFQSGNSSCLCVY